MVTASIGRDATLTMVRRARALEAEAQGLLPADLVDEHLARLRDLSPGARRTTRGTLAEALRDAGAACDDPAAARARALLAEADGLYWVVVLGWEHFAMRSLPRFHGIDLEDVRQWCRIGLYQAATRFDPERGISFATYSRWWAMAVVINEMTRAGRPVRVPRRHTDQARHLADLRARHPEASRAQLAGSLGVTPKRVRILDVARAATSYELPPDGSWDAPAEQAAPDEVVAQGIDGARALDAMGALPEREARVLRLRFGIGADVHSLEEVGVLLGCSKQRAHQVERAAIQMLRSAMGA